MIIFYSWQNATLSQNVGMTILINIFWLGVSVYGISLVSKNIGESENIFTSLLILVMFGGLFLFAIYNLINILVGFLI